MARIKKKKNVKNKDALEIVKRSPDCEKWLLDNGGDSWVSVIRDKMKRKADILQVFECEFPVVEKITKEVSEIYEGKFRNEFFLILHQCRYLPKTLKNEDIPFLQRVQFAALAMDSLDKIGDELFEALASHTKKIDQLPLEAQAFFISILPKMGNHIGTLFRDNFSS